MEEKKIIKLIEAYLNNDFKYHLEDIQERKRPFGNSGITQIFKDMTEIIGESNKKFEVSDEDELYDMQYEFMKDAFWAMITWSQENKEDYEIKLIKRVHTKEVENDKV